MQLELYSEQPGTAVDLKSLLQKSVGREKSKHSYEYQEVCEDLQKDFGKLVWTLPWKPFCTEHKLRRAGEIARQRGVLKYPYLVGILKKL